MGAEGGGGGGPMGAEGAGGGGPWGGDRRRQRTTRRWRVVEGRWDGVGRGREGAGRAARRRSKSDGAKDSGRAEEQGEKKSSLGQTSKPITTLCGLLAQLSKQLHRKGQRRRRI